MFSKLRFVTSRPSAHIRFFSSARQLAAMTSQVKKFIDDAKALCRPKDVRILNGSEEENTDILEGLIKTGAVQKLNQTKRPGCYIAFTDPKDVARAEKDTFICSEHKRDAGPTNNWVDPKEKMNEMKGLFNGCMEGRTMYVIPFSMGPIKSPYSKIGIQVTDSAYVAANMRIMTRMGDSALDRLQEGDHFVPCMHSVGRPISAANPDPLALAHWPCNIDKRNVCHFPETEQIWSHGSGYGGNSLLGKKCFALRIASVQARNEGWLAEHMLIVGITNPEGKKRYIAAAFPSACGKTNLAMMEPLLPGWKIETVGDDIAWMRPGPDGRLYAINPEFGFFGVAPGTSSKTNPNAMKTCEKNSLFTNVGLTESGDVYWEGMDELPKESLTSWLGEKNWTPGDKKNPCAQANSRFTTPLKQCPCLDPAWDDPNGVPIDAIIFGGRRKDTLPLIFETRDWEHGVFAGASLRSKATAAADQKGMVNDPMAMKAFIGYNVKDYFRHWLKIGKEIRTKPKIFQVNWFRENAEGKFIWPGFGDNIRALKWMFERLDNPEAQNFVETPIGHVPTKESLDLSGLNMSDADIKEMLTVDRDQWREELKDTRDYFSRLSNFDGMPSDEPSLPEELIKQLEIIEKKL